MRFLEHVLDRALTKTVPVVSSESSTCVCVRERKRERETFIALRTPMSFNVHSQPYPNFEIRQSAACLLEFDTHAPEIFVYLVNDSHIYRTPRFRVV